MHPAGRRDRQHGTGKPCATPRLRAKSPRAPQDGRPDGAFGHIVGGFDPGTYREVQRAGHRESMPVDIHRTRRSAGPVPWVRSSPNPDCIWRVRR